MVKLIKVPICEYAVSYKSEKVKFYSNKDQANSGTDSLYDMRKIGCIDDAGLC